MKHESFNESTEMYLKTIAELAPDASALVPISTLAERLGVSNVSATEMVHRLEDQKLLVHTPYKGVTLTAEGRHQATLLIRTHHLWEYFLVEELGLPWDLVHEYACRLEHATAPQVTEALAAYLQHPPNCPHGNPIPDSAGQMQIPPHVPLGALKPGQGATVRRIFPESQELLAYLKQCGIQPGRQITFQELAPFNGPLMVRCDGRQQALSREVAQNIFVEPQPVPEAEAARV